MLREDVGHRLIKTGSDSTYCQDWGTRREYVDAAVSKLFNTYQGFLKHLIDITVTCLSFLLYLTNSGSGTSMGCESFSRKCFGPNYGEDCRCENSLPRNRHLFRWLYLQYNLIRYNGFAKPDMANDYVLWYSRKSHTGWWLSYPYEKYKFVSLLG